MRLEDLRVIHFSKKHGAPFDEGSQIFADWYEGQKNSSEAFCLNSCLRSLWMGSADVLERTGFQGTGLKQELVGVAAYRFLLRVACGLESEIPGETDIFGQFKQAWKESAQPEELQPWVQRIFEDTKEIRSQYLRHVGSGSYGSLVRKLIQKHSGRGPVLLVGAGQLAQSIAPFLASEEVWIWNRGSERLSALADEMSARPGARIRVLSSAGGEIEAWKQAATVIVCVPADAKRDPERVKAWNAGCEKVNDRLLIHLGDLSGSQSGAAGAWQSAKNFHGLDELFGLQKTQGDVRSVQISQAGKACDEKAKLRALGASVGIPHGWEDLAVFA